MIAASGTVGEFWPELEFTDAEVLVTDHRGLGVTAGQAVRKHDLLVGGQRFATTFEVEADRFRFARRVQAKAAPKGHALAGHIVRFGCPEAPYVAVGRGEM